MVLDLMRQRLTLKRGGRFDPGMTADRLEALRELANVTPKAIGSVLWPAQTQENAARSWYRRANQKRQPFSLPEIERAVDYLAAEAYRHKKIPVRSLPGFPFIDLWVSVRIERGE